MLRVSGVWVGSTRAEQAGDAAELGAVAGRHHDGLGRPGGHEGAAVQQRPALGEFRGGVDRVRGLVHRHGLPGQGRLVRAQPARLQDPQVRDDPRPRLERHDVPGHEGLRVGLRPPPVAAHPRRLGHELGQCLDRLAGPVLLGEPDERVEHHDREHDRPVRDVTQRERDRRRGEERVDQRARALAQQNLPRRRAALSGEGVRAVLGQPPLRLDDGQPVGTALQPGEDLVGRCGVPCHTGRHGHRPAVARSGHVRVDGQMLVGLPLPGHCPPVRGRDGRWPRGSRRGAARRTRPTPGRARPSPRDRVSRRRPAGRGPTARPTPARAGPAGRGAVRRRPDTSPATPRGARRVPPAPPPPNRATAMSRGR